MATGTGLTCTKNTGTTPYTYTFSIPAGVHLLSATMRVVTVVGMTNFVVDTGTSDMGNTGLANKWAFNYSGFNESTGSNLSLTNTYLPNAASLTGPTQTQLNGIAAGPTVNHVKLTF